MRDGLGSGNDDCGDGCAVLNCTRRDGALPEESLTKPQEGGLNRTAPKTGSEKEDSNVKSIKNHTIPALKSPPTDRCDTQLAE